MTIPSTAGRWHRLARAAAESNLAASDKAVFRYLLDAADYATAELPARFTPTQQVIGRKTSHSVRQVKYSIDHLRRHGWLTARGATGPGKPLSYAFAMGGECDCTGRRHTPERVQRKEATVPTDLPERVQRDAATGATTAPERVQRTGATPQVNGGAPLRGTERGTVEEEFALAVDPDWRTHWPAGSIGEEANAGIELDPWE